jgi:hypothetical protein
MNNFDRANEALQHDLAAYVRALRMLVTALPQTRTLCDCVVKETRLARALLEFSNSPQAAELAQLAFHLTNLWPYREQAFVRTIGFADEIAEARRQREEARRGVRSLARQLNDPLFGEVSGCFENIARHLEEEQKLLEECHALIQPHAANMDLTRKRLNLLVATVDARVPASAEQQAMLQTYTEAVALLRDWENGVPLEDRGVDILEHCLGMLEKANQLAHASQAVSF